MKRIPTTVRNLCFHLYDNKRLLLPFLITTTFTAMFESLGVASLYPIIQLVQSPQSSQQHIETIDEWTGILLTQGQFETALFSGTACAFVLSAICFICSFFFQYRMTERVKVKWQTQVMDMYTRQPMSFFSKHASGDLVQRQMYQTEMAGNTLVYFCQMTRGLVVISGLFLLLLITSVEVTLIISACIPIAVFISYKIGRNKILKSATVWADLQKQAYSMASEMVNGIKQVKAFGVEAFFYKSFRSMVTQRANIYIKNGTTGQAPSPLLRSIAGVGVILVLYLVSLNQGENPEMLPIATVFAGAGYRIMGLLGELNSNIMQFGTALPSLNIVSDILQLKAESVEKEKQSTLVFEHQIEFRNVCFQYDPNSNFRFENLNLTLEKGKFYGIAGPSGNGKSTLIDLLLGFYLPQSGEILIDGVPLSPENIVSWRTKIGLVSQETIIFDGTLASNITFSESDQDMDFERVKQAAEAANLTEFIATLPQGYQTKVGERGVNLSGGQKQRLAIARAIYRRPDIYVFDEATSSLDTQSEQKIQQSIENLSHRKTVVAIAHRLSTIADANCIFVVKDGRIAEQGSHKQLMEKNGTYAELARMQEN